MVNIPYTAITAMDDEAVVAEDTSLTAIILICMLGLLAAGVFLIIYFIRSGRTKKLVKKTSPAYLGLQELNKKYEEIFLRFQQDYSYSFSAKSKQNYDHFYNSKMFNDGLKSILTNEIDVGYLDNAIKWNKDKYREYEGEYYSVVVYTTEKTFQTLSLPHRISYKRYSKYEHRMNLQKMNVLMAFQVTIHVYYNSPGGRNRYHKSIILTDRDVINRYNQILESERNQTEAQRQRSLLTPSLRYEVMKRDGFKCVICGRSAAVDGVKLHVDHIKPVAKGGKTEMSNLRTLCQDCNLGKSDTYDAGGIN